MNLDTFFEKLAATPRNWGLNRVGGIRTTDGCNCPITMVASGSSIYSLADTFDAGLSLGLSSLEIAEVVRAADLMPLGRMEIRSRLLKACGLADSVPRQARYCSRSHE